MRPQEYEVTETVARGWQMTCSKPGCMSTGPISGPGEQGRQEAIAKNAKRIPWPPRP